MTPRVSVVVPAYNNAEYLAETIDSILAQTFTDFELVIADHSSTDGTLAVAQKYDDPRIRLLTTRGWRGTGQLESRHRGSVGGADQTRVR